MSLEGKELGRYHLYRLIGSGGMGEVYLAEDMQVRRQVAVKVIKIEASPSGSQVDNSLRLFLREATAIASLDHPHILPLYDHGESILNGTHYAYLITPYRADGSLVSWLQKQFQIRKTPYLTPKIVEHFVQQAAGALQYAHDHQVIHQDVKPANFLIRNKANEEALPDLQLADFGIALLTSANSNASQSVRGTPLYMAPEQWSGRPLFASDQYSLAVMVYELLTNTLPFQGSPLSMMYAHLHTMPRAPRELNPQLPPAVDAILLRALAKKPEERFESVAAFARAFHLTFQESNERNYRALNPAPVTPIPDVFSIGDRRATLSISAEEARGGTLRSLTMPGGRMVNIQIPAGVQNGHVITLAGLGEIAAPGGVAGNLYLSLSVVQTQEQQPAHEDFTATLLRNYPSSSFATPDTPAQPLLPRGVVSPITPLPTAFTPPASAIHSSWTSGEYPPTVVAPTRQHPEAPISGRLRTPMIVGIILAMVLLLLGGTFEVYYVSSHNHNNTQIGQQPSPTSTGGTAQANGGTTATPNTSTPGAAGTPQPTSTATSTGNTSPGINWYQQNSGTVHYLSAVTWTGSEFMAAGDNGTVLTSPDGTQWTPHDTQHSSAFLLSVGCSHSLCVAVGSQGVILTSQDSGDSWTDYSLAAPAPDLRAIIWSGQQFVVVGTGGTILISSDGVNWQKPSSLPSNLPDLAGIRWTGAFFIAVGDQGTILTSHDGNNWTRQNSPTTANLKAAKQSNVPSSSSPVYMIVGEHGTVLTSLDTITWTSQALPSDSASIDLTGVTWGKSLFVISGAQGAILVSPDGQHWIRQQTGTNQDFECIASSGGKFVAVGIGGLIVTSA